jgi:hypothetical protein
MEKLDQGNLHPKLEVTTDMSWPGIKPGTLRREASTLERSHSNSLFYYYSEPLHGCSSTWGRYTWTNTGSASSNVGFYQNSTFKFRPLNFRH